MGSQEGHVETDEMKELTSRLKSAQVALEEQEETDTDQDLVCLDLLISMTHVRVKDELKEMDTKLANAQMMVFLL